MHLYLYIYIYIYIYIGIRNGVAALMKRTNPELVVTHCLAHRVELSFKDAIKSSKLYDKTITLLMGK